MNEIKGGTDSHRHSPYYLHSWLKKKINLKKNELGKYENSNMNICRCMYLTTE